MKLLKNEIYHIYNRGNRKQQIFFSRANYILFLEKVREHWVPCCDILSYCLMPNHFHFLIKANDKTIAPFQFKHDLVGSIIRWTNFSRGTQQLLSTYAKAINKQEGHTGSLFTQNTKAKIVSSEWNWHDYTLWCFRYILQNPVRAGLVDHGAEWEFSSYRDFAGLRNGTLCNMALAWAELNLDNCPLEELLGTEIPKAVIRKIF